MTFTPTPNTHMQKIIEMQKIINDSRTAGYTVVILGAPSDGQVEIFKSTGTSGYGKQGVMLDLIDNIGIGFNNTSVHAADRHGKPLKPKAVRALLGI